MTDGARRVQRTYLTLTLLATLATSFIWGINTLFLLDAGLDNTAAFAANAFYTLGQVVFEVPTGIVADMRGRRLSYLLGSATLLMSTLLYVLMWELRTPFWGWALASMLLGLGYTFFSGAVEAWLVDALVHNGFSGNLETVFGRGQVVAGSAMLVGSVAGGFIAQTTNLGVPYLVRSLVLLVTLIAAMALMRDEGFTPERNSGALAEMRRVVRESIDGGLRNRPVRWIMLAAPLTTGAGFYIFYAMQPYLLELWGNEAAFGIAGIAAAVVASSQIVGGLAVPVVRRRFARRTTVLLSASAVGTVVVTLIGITSNFWLALGLIVVWAVAGSASMPVRQAYLNGLIPSRQRATVLSFDSLMGSTGGVVAQPALGRVADVGGYGASYLVAAVIQAGALPFLAAARGERAPTDVVEGAVV